jgi:hypothetical protein
MGIILPAENSLPNAFVFKPASLRLINSLSDCEAFLSEVLSFFKESDSCSFSLISVDIFNKGSFLLISLSFI